MKRPCVVSALVALVLSGAACDNKAVTPSKQLIPEPDAVKPDKSGIKTLPTEPGDEQAKRRKNS
jgi:hypothetical protein